MISAAGSHYTVNILGYFTLINGLRLYPIQPHPLRGVDCFTAGLLGGPAKVIEGTFPV